MAAVAGFLNGAAAAEPVPELTGRPWQVISFIKDAGLVGGVIVLVGVLAAVAFRRGRQTARANV